MKKCRSCSTLKEDTEFNIVKSTYTTPTGDKIKYNNFRKDCRECHKKKKYENIVTTKYNFTIEGINNLQKLQNNKCAICENGFKGREPFVDHSHSTGHVRGLLCTKCNFGIGQFNDDIKLLKRASKYLKAWLQVALEGDSCQLT